MGARQETLQRNLKVVAGFISSIALVLFVAFYFLSLVYYNDRAESLGAPLDEPSLAAVRTAFAILLVILAAGAFCAAMMPRLVGHGLSAAAGLAALAGGVATLTSEINAVLPIVLFLAGVLFLVLTWRSHQGSRPAWAFLVAMCAVFGVIMLFGSTKVRNHTNIGLYYALIIPGLLYVATVALTLLGPEYRDR